MEAEDEFVVFHFVDFTQKATAQSDGLCRIARQRVLKHSYLTRVGQVVLDQRRLLLTEQRPDPRFPFRLDLRLREEVPVQSFIVAGADREPVIRVFDRDRDG
jgi:hypothetical protein